MKRLFKDSTFILLLVIVLFFVIINMVPFILKATNKNDVKFVGESEIKVLNTFPISDETGKIIKSLNVKEGLIGESVFKVVGLGDSSKDAEYEIYLVADKSNKIKGDYIKVYLTNNDKNRTPFNYYGGALVPVYRDLVVSDVDPAGRVIYSGVIKGGEEKEFLLRIWLSESYSLLEEEEEFFKARIYAKKIS